MNKITILFIYILFLIIGVKDINCQSSCEISIIVNSAGSNANVSLYIKNTGGNSWNLGISSFVFYLNNLALNNNNPTISSTGIWSGGNYAVLSTLKYGNNGRSLEVLLNTGSGTGLDVPNTPTLIGTLQFSILNPSLLHNILWDQIKTAIFEDDFTQVTNINFIDPNNAPLPIQLSSFSHSVAKNDITLKWATSKEINNKEFIVERKTVNSEVWNSSGIVEGKGNTNTITEYSFTDRNLQTGKYNYRLKQADYNGNFEYHNLNNIVEVGVPDKFEISQNYPNPFNPTTKIDYQLPFDSKVDIRLYDVTGREVKTLVNEISKAGYYTLEVNANQLSSGIYFYRIISKSIAKDFVMTKKMMLIK
jgi:hypothetical protein